MEKYTTLVTHCGKAFTAVADQIEYLPWFGVWKMWKITSSGYEEWFLRKIYVAEVIHHDSTFN
jgi:hypothetical protein